MSDNNGALCFKTSRQAIDAAMCFTFPGQTVMVHRGGKGHRSEYWVIPSTVEGVYLGQFSELLFTYENCTDDAPVHAPQAKWKG